MGEHDLENLKDCEEVDENDIDCADPVQDIMVEKIITHPKYDSINYFNDIALLRLATAAVPKCKLIKMFH